MLLILFVLVLYLGFVQLKGEKQARELAEQRLTRRKLAYDTLNRRALAWKAKTRAAKTRATKYKRALKQALVCVQFLGFFQLVLLLRFLKASFAVLRRCS